MCFCVSVSFVKYKLELLMGNQFGARREIRDDRRSVTGSLLAFDAKKLIEQSSGSEASLHFKKSVTLGSRQQNVTLFKVASLRLLRFSNNIIYFGLFIT